MVLVSFKMLVDPRMPSIPVSLLNFVTRTVIGTIWAMLLRVAADVRDGKRPEHQEAMAAKHDFYDWMGGRINSLLEQAAALDPLSSPPVPQGRTSAIPDEESHLALIAYLQS